MTAAYLVIYLDVLLSLAAYDSFFNRDNPDLDLDLNIRSIVLLASLNVGIFILLTLAGSQLQIIGNIFAYF